MLEWLLCLPDTATVFAHESSIESLVPIACALAARRTTVRYASATTTVKNLLAHRANVPELTALLVPMLEPYRKTHVRPPKCELAVT